MSKCPECDSEINVTKVICPHCSARTSNITPNKTQYNTMKSYKKHIFHKFMNKFCSILAKVGATSGIILLVILETIYLNSPDNLRVTNKQINYCMLIIFCVPLFSYVLYKLYIHIRRRIFQTAKVEGKFVGLYKKEHWFLRHEAIRKLRPQYEHEIRPIAEYCVGEQKYRVLSHKKLDPGEGDKFYGVGDAFDEKTTIYYDPQDPTDSRIKFSKKQKRAFLFNHFFKYLHVLLSILALIISILIIMNNLK